MAEQGWREQPGTATAFGPSSIGGFGQITLFIAFTNGCWSISRVFRRTGILSGESPLRWQQSVRRLKVNDLKQPTRHRGPLPLCLLLLGVVAVVVISPVALPSGSAEQQVRAPAVPRDEKLWRQALEIHRKAIVIDTHNDVTTPMANDDYDLSGTPPTPYRTSIDRMKQGGLTAEFF